MRKHSFTGSHIGLDIRSITYHRERINGLLRGFIAHGEGDVHQGFGGGGVGQRHENALRNFIRALNQLILFDGDLPAVPVDHPRPHQARDENHDDHRVDDDGIKESDFKTNQGDSQGCGGLRNR